MPKKQPSVSALVPERLDIAIRMPLARALLNSRADQFAQKAYLDFLECLNPNENFGENNQKYSFQDYLGSFRDLAASMKSHGFLSEMGSIPIGREGFITNGAHRVALGTLLGLDLAFHSSESSSHLYDQGFILSTGLGERYVDLGLLEVVRALPDTRFLVLFDSSEKTKEKLVKRLRKLGILWGHKTLTLNHNGQNRLIFELYGHNEWFKSELVNQLAAERMSGTKVSVSFFLIDTRGISEFQALKEQLRGELLGSQFPRKLHGTDGPHDTSNISELIYTEGGRHFLELSPPGADQRILSNISELPLMRNGHLNDWAVSGSAILEMHGGRTARDIDILSMHDQPSINFDTHNQYLAMKPFSISDLLWSSNLSFIYRGVKFLNLTTIACTKIYLGGEKNLSDVVETVGAIRKSAWAETSVEYLDMRRRKRSRSLRIAALLEWYVKKLPKPIERFLRSTVRMMRRALRRQI